MVKSVFIGLCKGLFNRNIIIFSIEQVMVSGQPNVPHAEKKDGVPGVPCVERFVPKGLPCLNPVVAIEGGKVEKGDGDAFRRDTLPESYGFRALKEDMRDVFLQVYTELIVW